MREGAISAPFNVFRRNMGQDEALSRNPVEEETEDSLEFHELWIQ